MTTEPFNPGATQDAIDEVYQEVIDESRSEAEDSVQSVEPPVEDPFAQAANAITAPKPTETNFVDKDYLDTRLGAFANAIREDVTSVVRGLQEPQVQEVTPDVVAFEHMITSGLEDPNPERVREARDRFIEYRDQLARQEVEESVPDILKDIQTKINNLENQQRAPQPQGWNPQEVEHITNAINYAAQGAGLNIDYSDQTQLNAVLNGVETGESADSVIRKVYANINRIGSFANQTNSNPANSVAASIPSMGATPTQRSESAIETREDFLEAVADGLIPVGDYPRYAHLFS